MKSVSKIDDAGRLRFYRIHDNPPLRILANLEGIQDSEKGNGGLNYSASVPVIPH